MQLEKQVVSLELAKKLKELGVKQESYFYWSKKMDLKNWRVENRQFFKVDLRTDISAFTVAELGEMLPITTSSYQGAEEFLCQAAVNLPSHEEKAETEADARAKMLIYLLENNLIKDSKK